MRVLCCKTECNRGQSRNTATEEEGHKSENVTVFEKTRRQISHSRFAFRSPIQIPVLV